MAVLAGADHRRRAIAGFLTRWLYQDELVTVDTVVVEQQRDRIKALLRLYSSSRKRAQGAGRSSLRSIMTTTKVTNSGSANTRKAIE